jgi:type I restriction enzyme, S subunit
MSQAVAAVHEVREPSAKYLVQGAEQAQPLVQHFNLLATAPGGVARLRELILTLAVQGKLVPQDPSDEPASELLKKIRAEKDRLIAEGKIKRDKPLAEIAEDEKPFGLPRGWAWVRLNSLLQKIGAGSTPLGGREVYVSSGVKFLRSQNVWDDGLRMEGVAFIKPETHVKMSGTFVVANDLLFNITGASIGRCAVVPSDFDEANVSQHVTIVRTVLPALNSFLHKVLVSRHVQQAVMDVQVGVSREGLSIAKLGQFLIPVPPLAEQSRIVARVEELMRLCDALEAKGKLEAEQHARLVNTLLGTLTQSESPEALAESWQRVAAHFDLLLDRPEAVDALEQTILQLAVRGLLVPQDPNDEPASELLKKIRAEKDQLIAQGKIKRDKPLSSIAVDETPFELPIGWCWTRWADIALKIGDIDHKMPTEAKDGVPYVSPRDFYGVNEIDFDGAKKISYSDFLDLSAKIRPEMGDLIYPRYGTIGVVRKVIDAREFLASYSCAVIKVLRGFIEPDYQYMYSISGLARGQAATATNKTTQPNVGLKSIQDFLVPLPPLAEQSRIVTRVNELRRLCADLRQRLSAQQKLQTQLAEALVAG